MGFSSALEYVNSMGTGINGDSVKTRPSRRAVQAKPEYYQKFYDRGFRHIRLRVVNDVTFDQVDDKGAIVGGDQLLDEIEVAVTKSLEAGLLPIVAYGSGLLEESVTPENEEKFLQWWVKCSDRLSRFDNRVGVNLMIEIGYPLQRSPEVVNRCYNRVIEYIRTTQPSRVIFCAPAFLSEPRKLKDLVLNFGDRFLGIECHDYASGPTKDPAHAKYWNESDPDPAIREGNRQRIRDTLNVAAEWRDRTGVPIWWGAVLAAPYNKSGGNYTPEEQAIFAKFTKDECTARQLPIGFNSDDKFIDMTTMEWLPDQKAVLNAITGVSL